MFEKVKKVLRSRVLNYIDLLLIVTSAITGWVSISAFTSLVGIPRIKNRIKNLRNNCRN